MTRILLLKPSENLQRRMLQYVIELPVINSETIFSSRNKLYDTLNIRMIAGHMVPNIVKSKMLRSIFWQINDCVIRPDSRSYNTVKYLMQSANHNRASM
jgi:hypothetical protein